jgi:hypothetical protein
MLSLVPTVAALLDTQLDASLSALLGGCLHDGDSWQFGTGADISGVAAEAAAAVLSSPAEAVLAEAGSEDSASGRAAVGIAHAISALALSTELLRLLTELVPQLLQPRRGGQSILSKIAAFDVVIKAWFMRIGEWAINNRGELRAAQAAAQVAALTPADRVNDRLERRSHGYAGAAMRPRSPRRPAATAIVRMMQLVRVAEVHVRRFHSALCKCVHHPTTRYHRARVTSAPPIDATTGCVLTPQSRAALALAVHGTQLTMGAELDQASPATLRMLALHTLAIEARGLLFEDRRREFFSLCSAYMLRAGVVRLALVRLKEAGKLAMEALRASAVRRAVRAATEASDITAALASSTAPAAELPPVDNEADMSSEEPCAALAGDNDDDGDVILEGLGPTSTAPQFKTARTAVRMLSDYLALLALCVSRQRMLSQGSHVLLAAQLPDPSETETSPPAPTTAAAEAAAASFHNDALAAALDLWRMLTAEPDVVPLPLISHLAAVLMLASVSASDLPPAASPPITAAGSRAAASMRLRWSGEGGSAGGGAAAVAFEPSESVIMALEAMGFDAGTVRFAMEHLRSNDTNTVVDFCLENDVAEMRATAAAAADCAAKAAADVAPAAEQPPPAVLAANGDMLTQRLRATLGSSADETRAPSATCMQSSDAAAESSSKLPQGTSSAFSAPPRFERVPFAVVADGVLRFCRQSGSSSAVSDDAPPSAFALQPLFGQLVRDAPFDAAQWLRSTLTFLFQTEVQNSCVLTYEAIQCLASDRLDWSQIG